jgi:hypothetical protein
MSKFNRLIQDTGLITEAASAAIDIINDVLTAPNNNRTVPNAFTSTSGTPVSISTKHIIDDLKAHGWQVANDPNAPTGDLWSVIAYAIENPTIQLIMVNITDGQRQQTWKINRSQFIPWLQNIGFTGPTIR